ncbi:hypothetical protein [Castellaniella sp.]|uniref:hypothetical protein n=1 Tax=Castellaniella sp. TaxID=1955812 RepID=UPI002AFEEFB9|nr:hypothetical protein [Castellaniella sp.]
MWAAIYAVSQLIVFVVCCWAVLSPRVNDGLLGRISLILMLFASLGCIAWAIHWPWEVQRPGAMFSLAVAGMAIRCWWMKTCGPNVRRHIKRRIRKCN